MYEVDLAIRVEDALTGMLDQERQDVMEAIARALARPWEWPAPGGWDGAVSYGRRVWVAFTAFDGGIEVYDVGRAG